jgi:ATP-binding cassette, subfamily C (CFTR/MRP), member 1
MANVAGALILISVLEHYFIIVALFLFVGYRYFQAFYSASARELKRLGIQSFRPLMISNTL